MTDKQTKKHIILQEIERRLTTRLGDIKRDFGAMLTLDVGDNVEHFEAGAYDAVVSHFGASFAENPPQYILSAGRLLRPDGLFLASLLGVGSFGELRDIEGAPDFKALPDVRDVGAVLTQYKFALPVIDRDFLTITFDSVAMLMQTLEACGFSPLLGGVGWLEGVDVPRREDGKIAVTLDVIYAHGWFPAAGQPEALKRGSAAVRLADVL